MVYLFITLISLIRIDPDPVIEHHFDVVEVNRHYNAWHYEKWAQVVFWNWHEGHEMHHVDYYYMLRNCYVKTESGEIAHNKSLDALEQFIDDVRLRQRMREECAYKGDFTKTELYPRKDWLTDKWIVEFTDSYGKHRIVCDKMMTTYTQRDPEIGDKKFQPMRMRSGLYNYKGNLVNSLPEDLQKVLQSL